MTAPVGRGLDAPNLDDRSFQDLVDDARNYVRARCPEWTDHNVSDPGIALIEAFAWMTDVLCYRLNRVTDRHYTKYLELLGVSPFPPSAAQALVSFRLSAHQPDEIRIERGTTVSTKRTPNEPAIPFQTTVDSAVVPAVSNAVLAVAADGGARDLGALMGAGNSLSCFSDTPAVGDALYISLDLPAPGHIVLLQFQCEEAKGHGIDPLRPPLRWEAWDGDNWAECVVAVDLTRGLNVSGPVEIHLPRPHHASYVAQREGHWIRCVVVEPRRERDKEEPKRYRNSPAIQSVTAASVGVDIVVRNSREVVDEVIGTSAGQPGQEFTLMHAPVLAEDDVLIQSKVPNGEWVDWLRVDDFAGSAPHDRHVVLDPTTGAVQFGPEVRMTQDGVIVVRQFGAVPAPEATLRAHSYYTGGGAPANVAAGTISVLRTSIPYVARVYNRAPARGGADGESMAEARTRGPLTVRARNRAITVADYETLTRAAAPELARVHARETSGGGVSVAVVPQAPQLEGRIELLDLVPGESTLNRVTEYLEQRRTVGAVVSVSHAIYRPVSVVAQVRCHPTADPRRVERDTLRSLYSFLNPVSGGLDGTGWGWGRPVRAGDVRGALREVSGITDIDEVLLFVADPENGTRTAAGDQMTLQPGELVFSYEHEVSVRPR